jgi:hypothetical protein
VDVDHVESMPAVDMVERGGQAGADGDERLGPVRVERERATDVDDVEETIRELVAVDRLWSDRQSRREHRDLVPTAGELRRLSVDVLGDPTELRVVVVGDDRDLHLERDATTADMTTA